MCYFEEGGMQCGTLKSVVWYFEQGCVSLEKGGVLLYIDQCVTLYRWVSYFEKFGVLLHIGRRVTL